MTFFDGFFRKRSSQEEPLEATAELPAHRLGWEPIGTTSGEATAQQVLFYMDGDAAFAQFPSGSCLLWNRTQEVEESVVRGAMHEARTIANFKVYPIRGGDYLVFFASALAVHVGREEYSARKPEIIERQKELLFPGESFLNSGQAEDDYLVGLYARGKLQSDAWGERAYTVVRP
ncbi:MAG: hypothetical protein Q7V16_06065 [Hydrogenophaga sp.]|nr:hypothetical protein [Hydrogenophaga sp.]